MSTVQIVNEACARIEAACAEIESAFEGTAYVFPTHGIACILAEAKREAANVGIQNSEDSIQNTGTGSPEQQAAQEAAARRRQP